MTHDRALKQAIRRRMEQTGEKYSEARRALLGGRSADEQAIAVARAQATYQLAEALRAYQEADLRVGGSRPPLSELKPLLTDKAGYEGRLEAWGKARDRVLDLFAEIKGVSGSEARRRLEPLLGQVGLLGRADWDGGVHLGRNWTRKARPRDALSERGHALNQAALEELARAYLEDPAADPLVVEAQAAWGRRRAALGQPRGKRASERDAATSSYWSLWGQWAESQADE